MPESLTQIRPDYMGVSAVPGKLVGSQESDRLAVRQRVVVPLGGVIREVLDELPVVPFRVVEVDATPMRMPVRHGRLAIAGGQQSPSDSVRIRHLVAQVVEAGLAPVGDPALRRFASFSRACVSSGLEYGRAALPFASSSMSNHTTEASSSSPARLQRPKR